VTGCDQAAVLALIVMSTLPWWLLGLGGLPAQLGYLPSRATGLDRLPALDRLPSLGQAAGLPALAGCWVWKGWVLDRLPALKATGLWRSPVFASWTGCRPLTSSGWVA
jgi:hypothetical protein